MKIIETLLPGVLIFEPRVFGDHRGFFLETWNAERYHNAGILQQFVQDNLSFSSYGVLRGLHYQKPNMQGKLVYVLQGEVFDVAVDIRKGSRTFGQWVGVTLSSENKRQFYVPEGFAHGFCVTSETALFAYKCTDFYLPTAEHGIRWDDPDIGIDWPIENPILSEKDQKALLLRDLAEEDLPELCVAKRDVDIDAGISLKKQQPSSPVQPEVLP
ncbi:dTDP-4-dehydrorhamnose 3,5-epimerase [Heliophilum fasciatum]|uniref:dTDP-4-dehydrorhamnose 3,5-epimerase n=1 Tax=Heliophilum fasciatum TaxID=35700 RepID=A0A4R2RVS2_9FIRM|nr:dTDP-4-dehydrorhamnose 3,5-epimerase [Heliophilum fasciatum]MCW2278998.1 dTDP-4-dehydrorhamnose 3,5-epimerase [Heliophilum fasciatum]TCP64051.1 dTDP-4-dehydrorhamnose 3,5-epimerase [Heliophilum fasciatum]